MRSAARALGTPLRERATDSAFLAAVFDCAQDDARLRGDLERILDGDDGGDLVLPVAATLVRVPARVSVGGNRDRSFYIEPLLHPRSRREAYACALALLLDGERPYGRDLRRCQLDGCGRFFLVYRPPLGRPRDRYCSNEHMQEAQERTASARVMRSRRKSARKQK